MESPQVFWERFAQPYIDAAKRLAEKIQLAVVCSTRGKTEPVSDYEQQSIDSRFYSLNEVEHLLGSLRGVGFLVRPFFKEDDFLRWVASGEHLALTDRQLLVLSTGSSFPGSGAKSLIPSFCRLHQIHVIGPDAYSASLSRNKYHANLILRTLGELAPDTWCFDPRCGWVNEAAPPAGRAIILKLLYEGASIGIDEHSVTTSDDSLSMKAKSLARRFNQPVIAQEFIEGYEIEVPIACIPQPHAIAAVGISVHGSRELGQRTLTYDISGADLYDFWDFGEHGPAGTVEKVGKLAESVAEVLGLRDLARVDFRMGDLGVPKVIDISTSPYISPHSSFAFAASMGAKQASELPVLLIGIACARLGFFPWPIHAHQKFL